MVYLIFNYTCLWEYGVCTQVQFFLKELKLQVVVGLQHGSWELNSRPLKEQYDLLTTEWTLQPPPPNSFELCSLAESPAPRTQLS